MDFPLRSDQWSEFHVRTRRGPDGGDGDLFRCQEPGLRTTRRECHPSTCEPSMSPGVLTDAINVEAETPTGSHRPHSRVAAPVSLAAKDDTGRNAHRRFKRVRNPFPVYTFY